MAKTAILTKDGLVRYDSNIKDYIKDLTDDTIYIDPDETSSEVESVDSVTSAKLVSYDNTKSGLESTNVQEALDTTASMFKANVRQCIKFIKRTTTNTLMKINFEVTGDKGVLVLKGALQTGTIIFSIIRYCNVEPQIDILNLGGAKLTISSNNYSKNESTDIATVEVIVDGIDRWSNIDVEFPTQISSSSVTDVTT